MERPVGPRSGRSLGVAWRLASAGRRHNQGPDAGGRQAATHVSHAGRRGPNAGRRRRTRAPVSSHVAAGHRCWTARRGDSGHHSRRRAVGKGPAEGQLVEVAQRNNRNEGLHRGVDSDDATSCRSHEVNYGFRGDRNDSSASHLQGTPAHAQAVNSLRLRPLPLLPQLETKTNALPNYFGFV